MYNIIFDDGNIRLLVAIEVKSKKECEDIIREQEKPECYYIKEYSDGAPPIIDK